MTPTQRSEIRAILDHDERIVAAFLLGSVARGTDRPDSDVDIAVLPVVGSEYSALDRGRLAAEIAEVIHREVDVGVLNTQNLIYAKEVFLTGNCIYCRDAFQRDLFGATALGLYAELRESRREVERAYQAG